MKRMIWFLAVLVVCAGLAGCKKSEAKTPPPVANNAHIDAAKLRDTLATNNDVSVQASLVKVTAGLRYGYDYPAILEELDKLSNNPSITPPQRKVVGDVMDQVKQFIAQQSPPSQ